MKSISEMMAEINSEDQALVNESSSVSPDPSPTGNFSVGRIAQDLMDEESGKGTAAQRNQERILTEYKKNIPKTWFGEMTHGVSRSIDKIQQAGAAVGSLATTGLPGFGSISKWLDDVIVQQDKDMEAAPSGAPSFKDIDSFDQGARYIFSTLGELAPDVVGAIASGGAGALVGRKTLQGVVERQAITQAMKGADRQVKNELLALARGAITKDQLQDATKSILVNETANLAGKYGALPAIALNSIGQEVGSIYADLKKDPNIAESDRKLAALHGGLVAGMAEFAVEGWVASKFFKGRPNVTKAEQDASKDYLLRFTKEYGKEFIKAAPGEGGTELFQTIVEEASKNWADPNKRDSIFTFTGDQKDAFVDSMLKGFVGGGLMAGGTAIAEMPRFPRADVNKAERDIDSLANDLAPTALTAEVSDVDKHISQISNQRDDLVQQRNDALAKGLTEDSETVVNLNNQIAKLHQDQDNILANEKEEEKPLVNEKKEEVKKESKANEMLQEVQDLRDQVSERIDREIGERTEPVDKEEVAAKRKELGLQGVDPNIQNALDDKSVNFLMKEGVEVREPTAQEKRTRLKNNDTFAVIDTKGGGIALLIPSKEARKNLNADDVNELVAHELIHVADLVQIRREAKEKGIDFASHENEVVVNRGKELRAIFPHIAKTVAQVYLKGVDAKDLSDRQLGQEFVRMAVEAMRKGKFEEVTDAIANAQLLADAHNPSGVEKSALKGWIGVIKNLYNEIKKMFDFKTAPEPIVRAVDQINKVLDKYGVLVEGQPKTKVKPIKETGTTDRGTTSTADITKGLKRRTKQETGVSNDSTDEGDNVFSNVKKKDENNPTKLAEAEGVRYDGPTILGDKEEDQFHNFSDTTSIPGTTVSFTVEGTPTAEKVKQKHDERVAAFTQVKSPLVNEKKEEPKKPLPKRRMQRAATAVTHSVEKSLTASEKSELGKLMGGKGWNAKTAKEFNKFFADWLAKTRRATGRLLELTKKVLDGISAKVLAIMIAFSPFHDAGSTLTPVNEVMDSEIVTESPTTNLDRILIPEIQYRETASQTFTKPIQVIGVSIPTEAPKIGRYSDMMGKPHSSEVARLADWVVRTGDNNTSSFFVGDKKNGNAYLFNSEGQLLETFPALFGKDLGDVEGPSTDLESAKRITPSGRFETEISESEDLGTTVQLQDTGGSDYAVAIHRLYLGDKKEGRPQRLNSATPHDNRISYGCINVAEDVMSNSILPEAKGGMVVYIMPESGLADPLVNENEDDRTAAMANLNPEEKREIASREGFKFDGTMMERLDLYTDYKDEGVSPSYGATIGIKIPYTEDDLMDKFAETRAKFSTPLVNENEAAMANIRNTGSASTKKALKEAINNANRISRDAISDIDIKESERRAVAGEVQYEGATPLDLEYNTRTHTGSTYEAQMLINEHGDALHVAEALERDILGKELGLSEFGPDSPLAAVYENVIRQLVHMARHLYTKGHAGSYAYQELRRLKDTLEENYRRMNNAGGSMSAYTGQSTRIIDGESAKKEAETILISHTEKIIGKEAKTKFKQLSEELNSLWKKYAYNVANSPKVIAALRKLHSLVNEKKFIKGARETVIKDIKKLEALMNRAAARASDYLSNKQDSEVMMNKVAENIVKEMSAEKKEANAPSEFDVFHSALREVGLEVQDRNKGPFVRTPENELKLREKFAVLMRNQGLYNDFITKLRNEYIKAYGGQNPTPEFNAKVDTVFGPMMGMPWTNKMAKALVNETLREFEVKLAKVVRQSFEPGSKNTFDETSTIADQVRNGLIQFMHDQGVEDQVLIDALAADIDTEINDSIENARQEFFTGRGTIREFLKSMGTTLAESAKQHAVYVEGMEQKFKDFLVAKGYPDTKELPIATTLAKAMQESFNEMVYAERVKIVKNWQKSALKKGANEIANNKMDKAIERVLQMANIGAIRQEDIYRALAEKFDLPSYTPDTAKKIQDLGDLIGSATATRTKDVLKQQLADFLTQKRGLKTSDVYTSWMYFSMLSGPSTWMVNIAGNTASMMGYLMVEAVKHPTRVPRMLRAMFRTMMGVGILEAKEVWWTGQSLGKQGEKYFSRTNPIEQEDIYLKKAIFSGGRLEAIDKAAATFVQKASRGLKGQYVGRFLAATDIFFYKVAEEMAYTARVGEIAITPQMWSSAMMQAKGDLLIQGKNPDLDKDARRQQELIAHSLLNDQNFEKSRFRDSNGALVNERVNAWTEARSEALDATFTQEPRGILGYVAKHIENLTSNVPILKLLVPFTRVAANVTNQMLDWTPYGAARWAFGHVYGDDFRVPKEGGYDSLDSFNKLEDDMKKRDSTVAIRAVMGTLAIFALIASADDEDDRDPFFTIYGDGPKDIELRRQMQQMGWKPNTIKVGGAYYSYLYTPLAMSLSIVGKQFDKAREGKGEPHMMDVLSPASAVALLDAVKNQSFLAGITDLFSALDSPDPETRVSRIMGRMATIPIPNFVKQFDKVIDPTVQEAQGFTETIIREIPIVRHNLKPALNIFGAPVDRTFGVVRFPGLERFMTMEKTSDPVLNMLSEHGLKVPGISKSTHLGDEKMTADQYYEYVQMVGPKVYDRYKSEIATIQKLSREAAQDRLEQISREEKAEAREELKKKYNISR